MVLLLSNGERRARRARRAWHIFFAGRVVFPMVVDADGFFLIIVVVVVIVVMMRMMVVMAGVLDLS